ncbi:MAG: sigma-54-dependent Fis family transcriptional regulator [Phycisphaerae bacterium]|nr:Regulatory protein AtoC [Phycisphaerales bacterium]MCK6475746.1 sigma-54 dependent transcriptional regulator [Phycisphaerales bacterium]
MTKSILLAEDEKLLRQSMAELLREEQYEVVEATNGKEAYDQALRRTFDIVITDVRMPEMDGIELLAHLQQVAPQTPVIVVTAFGTVESAVAAMRGGAVDYLLKPVQFDDVLMRVKRALELGELRRDQHVITEQLAAGSTFQNMIGESPAIAKVFELARKLSTVRSSVLIIGESGTGKELFARAVHYNGITRDKPFVTVNCGAIPESLIESELFGHRRGAFTGAVKDRIGYFEAANGGTLFLDEISTLPLGVQASFLRVLEERVVIPVGDTRPRPVDVRIIAASNQDLHELCRAGKFREDLLFRLDVVRLVLPPLRQRQQDIPLLVHHFLDKFTREMNKKVLGITNGAMRAMLNHEWRGNVRELENVIERAVIFAEGRQIGVGDLPFAGADASDEDGEDLKLAMTQFERQYIIYSLRRHRYDKTQTAKHLGIGISSLYRKLEELKIPKDLEHVDAPQVGLLS